MVMLREMGLTEKDGDAESSSHELDTSFEEVARGAERQIASGNPIVPHVLANELGLRLPFVSDSLRKMGYAQTNHIDPTTHMCVWENRAMENDNAKLTFCY